MNGRLLNSNNDVYLDKDNHVARAKNKQERTMRLIGTTLRTNAGECLTDYEAGVPWFEDVLGNSVLFADEIGEEIKDKICEIDGVVGIEDMFVEINGRNISGRYKVRLDNGILKEGEF